MNFMHNVYDQLYCAVYRTGGYLQVVQDMAKKSMQNAVDEVHTLPEYSAKGEVGSMLALSLFLPLHIICSG